mmetsp:Transcript_16748/g.34547  ORF Transcript_16748/g.34547 Transcript_16748/m.34547 type:complete len:228 (-) Transcript_16748:1687-2370(-)
MNQIVAGLFGAISNQRNRQGNSVQPCVNTTSLPLPKPGNPTCSPNVHSYSRHIRSSLRETVRHLHHVASRKRGSSNSPKRANKLITSRSLYHRIKSLPEPRRIASVTQTLARSSRTELGRTLHPSLINRSRTTSTRSSRTEQISWEHLDQSKGHFLQRSPFHNLDQNRTDHGKRRPHRSHQERIQNEQYLVASPQNQSKRKIPSRIQIQRTLFTSRGSTTKLFSIQE